ncbi:hypothetical protein RvY_02090 [Ramazzottius varieornatus]|uniref:Methyltransferase domain-containing protein n=1 Tax=Ramazzottius varieornatus TaxID=947166 RepID=A0A1D1UJD5_RAMVA|nr:hypothetical protein RvY_02090 [Ramazzottius varieornatus]
MTGCGSSVSSHYQAARSNCKPGRRHHGWKISIRRYSTGALCVIFFTVVFFACSSSDIGTKFLFHDQEHQTETIGNLLRELAEFVLSPDTKACRRKQNIGGNYDFGSLDGSKTICLDAMYFNNCLIYSFGIGDDWSFDDELHDAGCEIYSFDPTISLQAYRRNRKHWFYPWGLQTEANTTKKWEMLTLNNIKHRLRHEHRRIDILKMDVEGAEWKFFQSGPRDFREIGQLIVEFHLFMKEKRNRLHKLPAKKELPLALQLANRVQLLRGLKNSGLTLFHFDPVVSDLVPFLNQNVQKAKREQFLLPSSIQYELSFIGTDLKEE